MRRIDKIRWLAVTCAACLAAGAGAAALAAPIDLTAHSASTRVRVVYHGPRGLRGPRGHTGPRGLTGAAGPAGPAGVAGAAGTDHAESLTLNWRGVDAAPGRDVASTVVPGLGTLRVTCNPSTQQMTFTPASDGVRTAVNVSDFEATNATNEQPYSTSTSQPIVIGSPTQPGHALAPNGMLMATISVEPISGDGGPGPSPATLTVSSEYKVNDPSGPNDFCFVAAQVLSGP
jgi:hypothetical protein